MRCRNGHQELLFFVCMNAVIQESPNGTYYLYSQDDLINQYFCSFLLSYGSVKAEGAVGIFALDNGAIELLKS